MWGLGRASRRARWLRRHPFPAADWQATVASTPVLHDLSSDELRRLHDLSVVFLREREVSGCAGFVVDEALRRSIAAQACLLVLELDLDAFAQVRSVLVYPSGFRARRSDEDELGIVTEEYEELLGESWHRGPVVLNHDDLLDVAEDEAFNLVIHEFAHQLDLLDDEPDGVPPLHADMDADAWRRDFAAAREALAALDAQGVETAIDPYAATDAAEGFAVFSETFFAAPALLHAELPAIYAQLRAFYRQDPLARRAPR